MNPGAPNPPPRCADDDRANLFLLLTEDLLDVTEVVPSDVASSLKAEDHAAAAAAVSDGCREVAAADGAKDFPLLPLRSVAAK